MANPGLPVVERKVTAQQSGVPDVQSAYEAKAKSDTLMSDIGSSVAQSASNAMAKEMGYNLGQNPRGDLGPPITEFDKNLQETYHAQAAATLSLQAQQMFTTSEVAMSKAPKLTPELIDKTNNELLKGINSIVANAPSAVRSKLHSGMISQLIKTTGDYKNKMYAQTREDTKSTMISSLDLYSQQVYELALSGDANAAEEILDTANATIQNGLDNRYFKPEDVAKYKEGLKQNLINGKVNAAATAAYKLGVYPEFARTWAEKKPYELTDKQYQEAGASFKKQIDFVQSLKAQDESFKTQKMLNRIVKDPTLITDTEWNDYAGSVSPMKAEETKFKLLQALKSKKVDTTAINTLNRNYGDARTQANADTKTKNATFNQNVKDLMLKNPNMSIDEAEVQTAMSSGATVPVFTDTLKAKLWSGDPRQMDSAAQQINALEAMHSGHALMGLGDADKALYGSYEAQRNPNDPTVGARLVIENSQNLDPPVLKLTQAKWATMVDNNTRLAKTDPDTWILNKFGFEKGFSIFHPFSGRGQQFDNPFMATHYAADMMNKYKSFYELTRGNETVATKLTQKYIDDNYGQTGVNGTNAWTMHPIEKTLGFKTNDGVPAIHKDIVRQLSVPLAKLKQDYDKGISNEYYTIAEPAEAGGAIRITKHEKAELGTTAKTYDMALIGNNFDQWDVNIQTEYGPRNLFLESPMAGVKTYSPDRKWILDEYSGKPHPADQQAIPKSEAAPEYSTSKNVVANTLSTIGDFLIPPAFAAGEKESNFIKNNEGGFRKSAYKDDKGIWTIGYGHTEGVKEGDTITESEAKRLYKKDNSIATKAVNKTINVELNENQKKALTDLAYNIGPNAFARSTLAKKINKGASRQEIEKGFKAFIKETKVINGKKKKVVSEGLKNRRDKDIKLFFKE